MSLFKNSFAPPKAQTQISPSSCRHSLCSFCVIKLQQAWKISLDLQRISNDLSKEIPIAALVKGDFQKTEGWVICPSHGEKRDLFCLEHNETICSHCKIFGDCQNHKVKLVRDLQPQADEKKREMERIADNLQMAHFELMQLITEKQQALENLLKEFPAPQELNGKLKLFELSVELEAVFRKEQQMLNSNLGSNSDFATKVINKFKEYANYTQAENPLDLVTQDNSSFEESVYNAAWDYKKTLEEKLRQINQIAEQRLKAVNSSPNIDDGPTLLEIFRLLPEIEEASQEKDMALLRRSWSWEECLRLPSDLRIRIFDHLKGIEVVYSSQDGENVFRFNPNYCQDLDKLTFEPRRSGISEREMLTILYLQKKLNFKKFYFRLGYTSNIEGLGKIMASFFWNPSLFEELAFNVSGLEDPFAEFSSFFNEVVPQMCNLTNLRLLLSGSSAGDEDILLLARNVLPNLKKLKTFKMDLSQTQVKEDALLKLIKNIPRVKILHLKLEGVPVSDREVSAIAELLKDSNEIESLSVDISRVQCTDLSIQALFDSIPETIQDLDLDLQETGVTPDCIKNFLQFKAPYLNSLRSFDIHVDDESSRKRLCRWWEDLKRKRFEDEEAKTASKSLPHTSNTGCGLFASSRSGGGGLFAEKQTEEISDGAQNGGGLFSKYSGGGLFGQLSRDGGLFAEKQSGEDLDGVQNGGGLFSKPSGGGGLFAEKQLGEVSDGAQNSGGLFSKPSGGSLFGQPSRSGRLFAEKQPGEVSDGTQNGGGLFSKPSSGGFGTGNHLFHSSRLIEGSSFFGKSREGNISSTRDAPSEGH